MQSRQWSLDADETAVPVNGGTRHWEMLLLLTVKPPMDRPCGEVVYGLIATPSITTTK
jgi:hypothetical protein